MAMFVYLPSPQKDRTVLFCANKAAMGVSLVDINCALCNLNVYIPYHQASNDFALLLRSCFRHGFLKSNALEIAEIEASQRRILRGIIGSQYQYAREMVIIPESFLFLYQRFLAAYGRKLSPQIQRWMDNVLIPMFRHNGSEQEVEEFSRSQSYLCSFFDGPIIWRRGRAYCSGGLSERLYGSLNDDLKRYFAETSKGSISAERLDEFVDVDALNRWFRYKSRPNTGESDPELEYQLELERQKKEAACLAKKGTRVKVKDVDKAERLARIRAHRAQVRANIDAIKGSTSCCCSVASWDLVPSYSQRFKAAHKKAS